MRLLFLAGVLALAGPATAQTDSSFPACPDQQHIEQYLGSNKQYIPNECRRLTITKIQSGANELCLLDFETGGDPTFLEQLQSAAVPTKWWVACESLVPR